MPLSYVPSNKGADMLLHENRPFYKHQQYGLMTYWICKNYRSMNCKVSCTTLNGHFIKFPGQHIDNCPTWTFEQIIMKRCEQEIKDTAPHITTKMHSMFDNKIKETIVKENLKIKAVAPFAPKLS